MHDNVLLQAFVYLAAAVAAVPIARRLGMGAVLGYLLAGIVIGPFGLRLVGEGREDVLHAAEFGVVMMLFLIGLELRPSMLWRMRMAVVGLGGAQILGTAVLAAVVGAALGSRWQPALAVGFIVAMSSTAIVLQSLAEAGRLRTDAGQRIFSILLAQDIAVIPILAVLPLLATLPVAAAGESHGIATLAGWQQGIVVLAAVAAIVAGGRFLLRPVFRAIAKTRRSGPSLPASSWPTANTAMNWRVTSSPSRACCSACSSSRSARASTSGWSRKPQRPSSASSWPSWR
jgi:Kef-type K+ transport system membrane component KefB